MLGMSRVNFPTTNIQLEPQSLKLASDSSATDVSNGPFRCTRSSSMTKEER